MQFAQSVTVMPAITISLVLTLALHGGLAQADTDLGHDLPGSLVDGHTDSKRDRFAETRRVLAARKRIMGEAHPETIELMKELGHAMASSKGYRSEGLEMERKARELEQSMPGVKTEL